MSYTVQQVAFLLQTQAVSDTESLSDNLYNAFCAEVLTAFWNGKPRRVKQLLEIANERNAAAARVRNTYQDMVTTDEITGVVYWTEKAGTELSSHSIYTTSWDWVAVASGIKNSDAEDILFV